MATHSGLCSHSISVGFLFPVYSSYKAIRANEQDAIESWLMYWVVMAGLHAAENTVEWAVTWWVIPFYYEAKSIVILWLTLPQIQGSTYVYITYINPFLLQHEEEIDKTIEQTKSQAKAAGLDYMRRAYVYLREAVMRAILVGSRSHPICRDVTDASLFRHLRYSTSPLKGKLPAPPPPMQPNDPKLHLLQIRILLPPTIPTHQQLNKPGVSLTPCCGHMVP
ncbi:hypothetical protein P389DRAFT_147884 [Cystobasidium minutum MCA 4210]|uniref:uncharacterized protein n=1 Tax=Cystobasidium minutum MCA 4210 TaxID=1397322 RepID=UPI0034CE7346|eukprot:jgi/Rhomi1/147884/e_gw1.10.120.1